MAYRYNYNNQYKYKTYDKIYFIAPRQYEINEDIEKLNELFKDQDDFINEITDYSMTNTYKPNTKTNFISIKLKTSNLKEDVFIKIAKKINKELEKDFKIFMKTANDIKYTYIPETLNDKSITNYDSINKFLED